MPAQLCTLCTELWRPASLDWCERENLWLWRWIKRRGCAFLIGDRIWARGQASLSSIGWSFMKRGYPLRVACMQPKILQLLIHTIQLDIKSFFFLVPCCLCMNANSKDVTGNGRERGECHATKFLSWISTKDVAVTRLTFFKFSTKILCPRYVSINFALTKMCPLLWVSKNYPESKGIECAGTFFTSLFWLIVWPKI